METQLSPSPLPPSPSAARASEDHAAYVHGDLRKTTIFNFFTKICDEGKPVCAKCDLCEKEKRKSKLYALNDANSNQSLARHLLLMHEEEVKQVASLLQPRVHSKVERAKETSASSTISAGMTSDRLWRSFITFMIDFHIPVSSALSHGYVRDFVGLSVATHKAVEADMVQKRRAEVANYVRGKEVALCCDSGTNASTRTLDITVHCGEVSFPVACDRLEENGVARMFSAENIAYALRVAWQHIGSPHVVGFVGDNASNIQAAFSFLKKNHSSSFAHAWAGSCSCHTLQLFVVQHVISQFKAWEIVDKARVAAAISTERELKPLPPKIDSRWWAQYEALLELCNSSLSFLGAKAITQGELLECEEAQRVIAPWYDLSRRCERLDATIFMAVYAYCVLLPPLLQNENEAALLKFRHHVYRDLHLAAVALSPDLNFSALPFMTRQMLRSLLLSETSHIALAKSDFSSAEKAKKDLEAEVDSWFHEKARHPSRHDALDFDVDYSDFWDKHGKEWPHLKELHRLLCGMPASSAEVERMFATHSRIHTKARASLSEKAVTNEVLLRSFSKMQREAPLRGNVGECLPRLAHAQLALFLKVCQSIYLETLVGQLVAGAVVRVWFRAQPNPWTCELRTQTVKNSWEVTWHGATSSRQLFCPLKDEWEVVTFPH